MDGAATRESIGWIREGQRRRQQERHERRQGGGGRDESPPGGSVGRADAVVSGLVGKFHPERLPGGGGTSDSRCGAIGGLPSKGGGMTVMTGD